MNDAQSRAGRWAALALSLGVLLPVARGAVEFYVAPGGDDSGPGSRARPFATLEAARDALRQLRQRAGPPAGGATLWLRGGDYVRERAFELGAEDGGTASAPVTYRAARGERVRLVGGRALKGFQKVTAPEVLARLAAPARAQVFQVDLRALGLTDYGGLQSRGFGRPTRPAHAELFFDGRPATLARWPNEGEWAKIAGFAEGQGDDHGGSIGKLAGGFKYEGDRPRGWASFGEVWVHGYWAWDWANSYERVASVDQASRTVKTAPPHGLYGFRKGQRYYFLNVIEELDQPGEYYLDRAAGRLYFWPPQPWAGQEVWLSVLEQPFFALKDCSYVTIQGLGLEAARGTGVTIRGGASNRVAGCALRLLGNYGVTIEGGQGHCVVSCDLQDTGDGGVSLAGGDRQTLTPGGHSVENCWFQRQGRWSKCYVPAVILHGVGHRVAHNLIQDHPHCAILFSGNEHQIEFNEIHHVALETGDVGAIYVGRDWTYRGNRIRHNFIHHVGGVGMGAMGAYMDDCVSGTELYGNIFYRVSRAAFLGGGRDHRVENNVFVECQPAVQVDGRGLDHSPVWHNMVYDYMKQQLGTVPASLYRQRYPALAQLDAYYAATNGVPPEGNVIARNICAGGKWLEVGWHARPAWLEVTNNLVEARPGFVDPDKMDFSLRPDSPAFALGFQPIPTTRIGLQNDDDRRELKRRSTGASGAQR